MDKKVQKFVKEYKEKVFRVIKKFKLVKDKDNIFIALSGGKDSGAAAYMLAEYVKKNNIDCKLTAFHINFNLPISNKVEEVIRKQASLLGLDVRVINVKEYNIDMVKIAKLKRPICSSCGIIKRYLINKVPREEGATKVATGHHADDYILFFFKNILGGNYQWSAKFMPLLATKGKSIARIRPLFTVGSKENRAFCEALKFPYIHEDVCPHVYLKCKEDVNRFKWYDVIEKMSEFNKNFRERFCMSIAKLAKLIPSDEENLRECKKCGEPTNQEICGFCKLIQQTNEV